VLVLVLVLEEAAKWKMELEAGDEAGPLIPGLRHHAKTSKPLHLPPRNGRNSVDGR